MRVYKVTPALTNTLTVNPDFPMPVGHPPGQHDAVLAVHAGNPRFLPAGCCGVRIRWAQLRSQFGGQGIEQREAVLLAQYRPGARAAGGPAHRRQIVRTVCRLRHRRVQRLDRQDAGGTGRPDLVGGARDASDLRRVEIGVVFTTAIRTGLDRQYGGGADFQYRNSNVFGDSPAGGRVVPEELL